MLGDGRLSCCTVSYVRYSQDRADVSEGPSLGRRHCAAHAADAARHGSDTSTPVEQTLPEIVLCIQRQAKHRSVGGSSTNRMCDAK